MKRLQAPTLVTLCLTLTAAACGDARMRELSAALDGLLAGDPVAPVKPAAWTDVKAFYANRQNAPVWVTPRGPSKRAAEALDVLHGASAHGLTAADYGEQSWIDLAAALENAKKDADRTRQLAELDARITTALMALGRDVALGRTKPEALEPRWKNQRTPPDFVAALSAAADGQLAAYLDGLRPRHPEYAALQTALASLRAQGASATDRIGQVELNLDRWRWVPDDFGARHFLVNIPSYRVVAREDGKTALDIRVVVGKPGHETPIFSDEMTTVVFSPYWNIPDSIVAGETAPAVARDAKYLERNGIEILRVTRTGSSRVDPSDVEWDDPAELKQLAFRQRPGAGNALGHVKFLFPNEYDVYLHDTPADDLFNRPGRAFSHGCVRVEEPEVIARYVLRGNPEWDDAKIAEAMRAGVEKQVKLDQTIPVHIVYFTAWVDQAGQVQFGPDVYGYDARQQRSR